MKRMVMEGIVGIVVLFVLLFLITTNTAITTPEHVVQTFYSSWISKTTSSSTTSYQHAIQLSEDLKEQIYMMSTLFPNETYDPIVCAKEFPQTFEIIPIQENKTYAEVDVREYFETMVKDIKVVLKKEHALWKIANVMCEDMPRVN